MRPVETGSNAQKIPPKLEPAAAAFRANFFRTSIERRRSCCLGTEDEAQARAEGACHLYDHHLEHDVACERPAAGPLRKWKTVFVFQGALAPSSARVRSRCGSARSIAPERLIAKAFFASEAHLTLSSVSALRAGLHELGTRPTSRARGIMPASHRRRKVEDGYSLDCRRWTMVCFAHKHQFLVCIATSHKPTWGQIHIHEKGVMPQDET